MFGVPDQKGWVDSDFLKEILCLQGGGQPVKTDVGEFLFLHVALIFDPIPSVCFDGPKYDGILVEQHFYGFPVSSSGPELLLAEKSGDSPGHCLVDGAGKVEIQPDHSLHPFPFNGQCAGIVAIQDPIFSFQGFG